MDGDQQPVTHWSETHQLGAPYRTLFKIEGSGEKRTRMLSCRGLDISGLFSGEIDKR